MATPPYYLDHPIILIGNTAGKKIINAAEVHVGSGRREKERLRKQADKG